MEKTYAVSTTEAAQIKKKVALEQLVYNMTQRSKLMQLLSDNQMQIALMEERQSHPDDTHSSDGWVEMELNKDQIVMKTQEALTGLRHHLIELVSGSQHPEKDRGSSRGSKSRSSKTASRNARTKCVR